MNEIVPLGYIAQSVEQSAFNQLVVGSSPTIPIDVSFCNQKEQVIILKISFFLFL